MGNIIELVSSKKRYIKGRHIFVFVYVITPLRKPQILPKVLVSFYYILSAQEFEVPASSVQSFSDCTFTHVENFVLDFITNHLLPVIA